MNTNSSTGPKPEVNVTGTERIFSAFLGGILVYKSLCGHRGNILKLGAGGFLLYRAITGNCPAYTALGKKRLPDPVRNINIRSTIIVNKPRHEVYAFWRRLGNLPLFMKHLKSVEEKDSTVSHWVAGIKGIPGTISWDATIVKDEEGVLLGWNSLPGSTIDNAGKVEFFDAGEQGTEIHAVITYRAPLGPLGEVAAKWLNPSFEKMVHDDLANFKTFIEAFEIPVISG